MRDRRRLRASYGCDCEGPVRPGRENPGETDTTLAAVKDFTGSTFPMCPWRATSFPIVRRVLLAYPFYRDRQLSTSVPHASHKLITAIGVYHRALTRSMAKHQEIERQNRERERDRGR